MSFNPGNYNPNKYRNQAGAYGGMIGGITGSLSDALSELGRSESVLGLGKKKVNDLLTYNVISSTAFAKAEINSLKSDLSSYSSLISAKAVQLDEEAKQEYLKWLEIQKTNAKRAREKMREKNTNIETTK